MKLLAPFPAVTRFLLAALLASATSAQVTKTWNGSVSTSWGEANNWTPAGVPASIDDIVVPDAATTPNDPATGSNRQCRHLTIEAGGTVQINSSTLSASGDLTLSGSLTGPGAMVFNGASQVIACSTSTDPPGFLGHRG
jgi:hypothetical protein